MRNPGLEPGSLAALEPESSASAIPPVPLAIVLIHNLLLLRSFLALSSAIVTPREKTQTGNEFLRR